MHEKVLALDYDLEAFRVGQWEGERVDECMVQVKKVQHLWFFLSRRHYGTKSMYAMQDSGFGFFFNRHHIDANRFLVLPESKNRWLRLLCAQCNPRKYSAG